MTELSDLRAALKVAHDPNASMEDAARASARIEEISPELLESLIRIAETAQTILDEIHNRVTGGAYDDEAGLSEILNSVDYINLEHWLAELKDA